MSSEDSNKKLDAEEVLANLTPSEIHSEELFTAAFNGDTSEVKRLITIGANVNVTEKDGNTLLHIASSWGHIDVVKLLVDKGANVNAKQKVFGDTPLHWASLSGRIDVLELLVAKGAAVNAETKNGETPLHWASANIDVDVVKFLIAKGADVNAETKNSETPLNVASRWGHINVAKLLIANKTDVNTKKEEGETPALKQNDKTTLENNPRDLRPFKRTKTSSNSTKVVEQWLKSHLPSLQNEDVCKYSASLVEDGFDSIDTLDVLEEEHLGFMKTGHRLLLLRKLGVQRPASSVQGPGFEV